MRAWIFSPEAVADLESIVLYIAQDNRCAAIQWHETLRETLHLIGDMPGMGRTRPELAAHLRSFRLGSYLLFYRSHRAELELVRVLHGSMDLDSFFEGEA